MATMGGLLPSRMERIVSLAPPSGSASARFGDASTSECRASDSGLLSKFRVATDSEHRFSRAEPSGTASVGSSAPSDHGIQPFPYFPAPTPLLSASRGQFVTGQLGKCSVIYDGWLAWKWVLPLVGYHIEVKLDLWQITVDQLKAHLGPGCTVFASATWKNLDSFWDILSWYTVHLGLRFGDEPRLGGLWTWYLFRHKDCDGITTGSWWCGTSGSVVRGPKPCPTERRLGHILNPMLTGRKVDAPEWLGVILDEATWTMHGYHPGGFLPLTLKSLRILALSVFSGHASWLMALDERLMALDIPSEWFDSASLTEDIVYSTPAKVLFAFAKELLGLNDAKLMRETPNDGVGDETSSTQTMWEAPEIQFDLVR